MRPLRFLLALVTFVAALSMCPVAPVAVRGQDEKPAEPAEPNVFVDVSARLVKAAVAHTIEETEPIHESVLETEISGMGWTTARARAELLPNPDPAILDLV